MKVLSAALLAAAVTATPLDARADTGCTALKRREGVRQLVKAFISGTEEDINKVPLADNVITYFQPQGARVILGRDLEGARDAIRLVHTITTTFGPDVNNIDSYLDNGVDFAFVNGTADVGLTLGNLRLPLVRSPAAQSLRYNLTTCKAIEAVGTVEPVDGLLQLVLQAAQLQNLDVSALLKVVNGIL